MDIFIDLDGTLVNIFHRYYALLSDYFKSEVPFAKEEYISLRKNGNKEADILHMKGVNTIKMNTYLEFRNLMIEDEKYLLLDTLFDLTSLERLRSNNKFILITFRKNRKNLVKQLYDLKIHSLFNQIITPEKKHSSALEFKSGILKNHSNDKMIIGDTEADIVSGMQNNIFTVGVLSGLNNQDKMARLNPSAIIDSIENVGQLAINV